MTNQEILESAIQKAIDGGWERNLNYEALINGTSYFNVFDHDFAKALWGEEDIPLPQPHDNLSQLNWAYHLQQMVLAEDPIKYLEHAI